MAVRFRRIRSYLDARSSLFNTGCRSRRRLGGVDASADGDDAARADRCLRDGRKVMSRYRFSRFGNARINPKNHGGWHLRVRTRRLRAFSNPPVLLRQLQYPIFIGPALATSVREHL